MVGSTAASVAVGRSRAAAVEHMEGEHRAALMGVCLEAPWAALMAEARLAAPTEARKGETTVV
eukprot:scaffold21803_cov35-Tisochrysis_lutea.AAC.1